MKLVISIVDVTSINKAEYQEHTLSLLTLISNGMKMVMDGGSYGNLSHQRLHFIHFRVPMSMVNCLLRPSICSIQRKNTLKLSKKCMILTDHLWNSLDYY